MQLYESHVRGVAAALAVNEILKAKDAVCEDKPHAPHVDAKGRNSRRCKVQEFSRPTRVQYTQQS